MSKIMTCESIPTEDCLSSCDTLSTTAAFWVNLGVGGRGEGFDCVERVQPIHARAAKNSSKDRGLVAGA